MIKEILEALQPEQYKQFMYAFEQEFAQIIIYEPGKFIGVNVGSIGNLDLINQEGVWSVGKVKSAN